MSAFPAAEAEKSSAKDVLAELRRDGVEGRSVVVPMNTEIYPNTPDGWRAKEKEHETVNEPSTASCFSVSSTTTPLTTGRRQLHGVPEHPRSLRRSLRPLAHSWNAWPAAARSSLLNSTTSTTRALDQVLPAAIDALIDALYGTVEPGRTNALRECTS